jgi:hypothetical protein
MKIRTQLGGIAAAAALVVMAGQGVASAAQQWNTISGTTYSNGDWYLSTVLRHHETTGYIDIKLPTLANKGLDWELENASSGAAIGSEVYIKSKGTEYRLATNVKAPVAFYNDFRSHDGEACSSCSFAGSEFY